MDIKQTLIELKKLLSKWGLLEDDWFLILHYADILQGYNIKHNRDEHLHIMIRHDAFPWNIKKSDLDREVTTPSNSKFYSSFYSFVKTTGYDFHIFVGSPKIFDTIKTKYFIWYRIVQEKIPISSIKGNLFFWKLDVPKWSGMVDDQVARRRFIWLDQIHEMAKEKGDKDVEKITGEIIKKYRPKDKEISMSTQTVIIEFRRSNEIKGTAGYKGKIQGNALMIKNPDRPPKVKKGIILVSKLTSPKLVPHIKASKAVVTDEGGILSHAAVFCREFKIPCIVGTRIATKFIKTGDKVEVDANKGVVKKI